MKNIPFEDAVNKIFNDEKMKCASRLKLGMVRRGMKQVELCDITGIPKSAMSQYIAGRFKPKQDRIYLISKALNVSPAWLMGYDVPMEDKKWYKSEKDKTAPETKNISELSAELQELVTVAADLPPEKIKTLTQVAESMKN